jgi:pimeloyl-ACP methyl ester carboxylesterase
MPQPSFPVHQIPTRAGLVFDAWLEGPADGALVLLLHGYPQSRHSWREQLPALAQAGYRALAPDQRGYSPGARPDPAQLEHYRYENLIQDAIDLADACAGPAARFHLVGHDWGGQVAWGVADRHPQRLASLTILSRPHPSAFARALQDPAGDQRHRSRHHRAFLDPQTGPLLLADGARRLRARLTEAGVPAEAIEGYLSVLGTPAALEAALAWYRANVGLSADLGRIRVPTLFVWGDADQTVGRAAAEGTPGCVEAACRFEALPGIGHFASDECPERVSSLLLAHLAAHPA